MKIRVVTIKGESAKDLKIGDSLDLSNDQDPEKPFLRVVNINNNEVEIIVNPYKFENNINVEEGVEVGEVLTKEKKWFNGTHTFSTVKIDTPSQPKSLGINVTESTTAGDKIGSPNSS